MIKNLLDLLTRDGKGDEENALHFLEAYCAIHGYDLAAQAVESYKQRLPPTDSEVIFVNKDFAKAVAQAANLGRVKSCKYFGGHWHVKV